MALERLLTPGATTAVMDVITVVGLVAALGLAPFGIVALFAITRFGAQ
jgi:hypothetical protein